MGEQGDPLSNFGGWGVPSPNSDFYTSSILENGGNSLFSGPTEGTFSQNIGNDGFRGGQPMRQSEPKMNTGGRLVERMAARAGFDAPRLNTEGFRPSGGGDSRSTFLTIPPGLSPTTLLESPVFLSNQMAQPSPTTGQFPFAYGGVTTSNFSFAQQDVGKDKENLYGGSNPSSFAFRPVPDSGPSSLLGATNNNFPGFEVSKGISNISSPPDEQEDEVSNQQQPIGDEPLRGAPPEDDGYNWRKYGQKQVKGSDYPRSYFKCSYENCLVKKKVERTQEGDLLEIVYKGSHYHPKPQASRRTGMGMSSDLQIDCVEVTSSASLGAENLQSQTVNVHELEDVVDGPSAFRNDSNEEDDRVTHVSASEDESESKRRRVENYSAADMSGATRAIREPRVVVQTTSEVDILDDGYRWRKYGQKVVKGNPNPRSYYKCTHAGCSVRKHVERASHDLRSVITTYEGKHNHEVPAARNTSHHNSGSSNNNGQAQSNPALPAQLQRPEQPLLHTAMARFDRPDSAMGSFGRQQMGSSQGFGGFGMGQQVLANLPMAGLGAGRNRFPMPAQMPLGQQQNYSNYNEMGFMLPKEEMKMEPFGEAHGNIPNGSAAFQQMMNRMPLGPQI